MPAAELVTALERAGFTIVRAKGGSVRLSDNRGHKITIPNGPGEVLKPKTLDAILVLAGLSEAELQELQK